jgi:hypothetical protein
MAGIIGSIPPRFLWPRPDFKCKPRPWDFKNNLLPCLASISFSLANSSASFNFNPINFPFISAVFLTSSELLLDLIPATVPATPPAVVAAAAIPPRISGRNGKIPPDFGLNDTLCLLPSANILLSIGSSTPFGSI